jgi:hypothetical protein
MSTEIKTQKLNLSRTQKSKNSKNQKKSAVPKKNRRLPQLMNFSAVLEPLRAKHSMLPVKSSVDGFELLKSESKSDLKEQAQHFINSLGMLKGVLFKRDQPYRTRLPLTGVTATSSSGILNATISSSTITTVAEWSSIDALFDEFFIHSITYHHRPQNDNGAGIGVTSTGLAPTVSTTTTFVANCSLAAVSIFNGAAAYSANSAQMANATVVMHPSGEVWKYRWLNNQRFDPRGDCVDASGWQGWTLIGNASNYGGQIQVRALNDTVFGTGSASVTLGNFVAFWDVSFRARS